MEEMDETKGTQNFIKREIAELYLLAVLWGCSPYPGEVGRGERHHVVCVPVRENREKKDTETEKNERR